MPGIWIERFVIRIYIYICTLPMSLNAPAGPEISLSLQDYRSSFASSRNSIATFVIISSTIRSATLCSCPRNSMHVLSGCHLPHSDLISLTVSAAEFARGGALRKNSSTAGLLTSRYEPDLTGQGMVSRMFPCNMAEPVAVIEHI
jgi:hypothetical protein